MSAKEQIDSGLLPEWKAPAILLVDLDAFFASVEQLDHPEWRGKPVIVGGKASSRGVVSTCSYEARAYGVRSAMPAAIAERLCPDAIWTHGHFDRYKKLSSQVMAILRDETLLVQQVSIDEAFMDVSPTRVNKEHPVNIAKRIIKRVDALGITCSIGVGTSKSIAKIASDMDKPHGLTVVYPGSERIFLDPLPIRTMSGIGPSAEKRLKAAGVNTLKDFAEASEVLLTSIFGKNAEMMRMRALGLNDSDIDTHDEVKSISKEITFAEDISTYTELKSALSTLTTQVARRLRLKNLRGRTITLRIRFSNMETHTIQTQLTHPTDNDAVLIPVLLDLLKSVWEEGMHVRLVGVGISKFNENEVVQDSLFPEENESDKSLYEKHRSLSNATDNLKNRFGEKAVRFGHEILNEEKTTGTSSKNPADYK
ncbi:DNA polymerase IV [Adlercreutzia sp. ZJ304]|uniref:DNA polymerase IV n=1 Tax=Adlercreutzia sp. ZJ304 TaxID=2709791 RepID=UPI001F155C9C|nr:DNA polymerase IV [Adlercreutzia sp. ZJ304]